MLVHLAVLGSFVALPVAIRFRLAALVFALLSLGSPEARAEASETPARAADTAVRGTQEADDALGPGAGLPQIVPSPGRSALYGLPLKQVVFRDQAGGSDQVLQLKLVRLGDRFSPALARRAMSELLRGGEYAELSAEAEPFGDGVRLRLTGLVRKVVADLSWSGGELDAESTTSAARIAVGDEVTQPKLRQVEERLRELYQRRGFPDATVSASWGMTDDPSEVRLAIAIEPGEPRLVTQRSFRVQHQRHPELGELLRHYAVLEGQRADEDRLKEADDELTRTLSRKGWYEAGIRHELGGPAAATQLVVVVDAGPRYRVRFEGNHSFDSAVLRSQLELEDTEEPTKQLLTSRIRDYYVSRGFFDARVQIDDRRGPIDVDRVILIRENGPLRVAGRTYPCLTGERSTRKANEEIDGVLGEQLPGGDTWFEDPPSDLVDETMGARGGHRVQSFRPDPWRTYSPEAYERALNHLRDLYRAEGYLSAVVGPVSVLRRACSRTSPPGRCEPLGVRVAPASTCPSTSDPFPVEDAAPDPNLTCTPDPSRGVYCEPNVVLSIPVKLGPRTTLWDIEFDGNKHLVEEQLAATADLALGKPVSQVELQRARRRILDLYADEGYAFAGVDVDLRLSQDQTRGSARFVVSERERVRISAIVVRGARETSESLILGRLELHPNGYYKRQDVRRSEEQLATLGVFSSVTISLEDPDVPAKQKVVLITVAERLPQYVDVKPGFSTGEGARVAFEYGHRNLAGKAVQLRFRVQLGYLPSFLLFESRVRRNFEELSLSDRLERRNTATLEFPVGKRYRLSLDGVDARDNSRDFGITKRAFIVTLTHRPSRQVSLVTGSSFELNDARVFGDTQNLQEYLEANPQQVRLLNVPEGRSFAVAVRGGAAWDRTDNPLGPTRGTFISGEVEPVVAYLDDDSAAVQLQACQGAGNDPATCEFKSRFLKVTNRVAGYLPLTKDGLSLALSVRWGANFQLVDNSSTYPDRLFFMGGADSLRGFLQASLIPQDIAEQLQEEDPDAPDQEQRLTARKVVIRGGDFILNPRIELRIPLTKLLQTAIFVDSGNVWRDIDNVDPTVLRYTAGSGLRFVTPVGPLAFDYGFKLDRRFYESDIGAFHFSVGLF